MKVLVLFLVCLFAFNFPVIAQSDIKLEIGAKLPRKYIPREIKENIFISPYEFRPFIRKTINDVDYTIAFEEKNRKIEFIQTFDRDFRTTNGLCIGSEITVTRNHLIIHPSWYIYASKTPDGWIPIVGSDFKLSDNSENDLSNLKDDETRSVKIFSFVKSSD